MDIYGFGSPLDPMSNLFIRVEVIIRENITEWETNAHSLEKTGIPKRSDLDRSAN